ncbi:MAG TPA: dihydrodipicolinate synthase family protein [Vicinamibacterales bacterium]|nr:dihydrodipicolinate synthase family protein [Vicinamibacterales bacterium]
MRFSGVFSVLPTPFLQNGDVDHDSLRRIVDQAVAAGVDGVTVLGVTSEVARLDERERRDVLTTIAKRVEKAARPVHIVAGATADGLRTCIGYAREAQSLGAAAVMISPPRLAKLNSEAVVAHFAEVSAAVDMPIVVQDYPPISGFAMEPPLLVRIAREVPQARTIKLEDPPTPSKITKILAQANGIEIDIFGGLGGVFLLEELMNGAAGAMTGFAYPEALVEIVGLYASGNVDEAAEVFYDFVPLMRFEFQEGIGMAIRKEVLRRRGVLAHPGVRPPGPGLDPATGAALDRLLRWTKARRQAPWISV